MKENKTIIKQEPNLTQNAIGVLEKRYLLRDKTGRICETPAELFKRVASVVAGAEKYDRDIWLERFYNLMVSKRFMPNSPTLMNAGKQRGQLSACFVLPVEDSLESIFEALKFTASIHQSGGGTGFSFSKLRPRNSIVGSTQGVASGPVSFIKIFDITTETIKQGGARRGANMAVLRVDHPDIIEFIDSKRDFHSITNFNISVGVTNEFMRAVMLNSKFVLRNPTTGKKSHSIKAGELFSKITQAAWECGDPG
ncbi:MAG: ribonucleotide reductase N-terminal alpha domain-containing protein, partial [Candidatus Poribacteria bacterium]